MQLTLNSWVLAYCPANDHYHIDQLGPQITANLRQYFEGVQNNTYMFLGIFATYEECSFFAAELRTTKEKHQLKRA